MGNPLALRGEGGIQHLRAKCLIAAIEANGQAAPDDFWDAPNSFQVAQRNVQLFECQYPLTNATTSDGWVELRLTVPDGVAPELSSENVLQVTFDDPNATWHARWVLGQGDYAVLHNGGRTTVQLGARDVSLAPVPLAAGHSVTAEAVVSLATGEPETTIELAATLTDVDGAELVTNGGSCVGVGESSPQ